MHNNKTGAVGGGDAAGGAAAAAGPTEEELQARAEAEERRKDKHRKMEHDREKVRKGIRDKVTFRQRKLSNYVNIAVQHRKEG